LIYSENFVARGRVELPTREFSIRHVIFNHLNYNHFLSLFATTIAGQCITQLHEIYVRDFIGLNMNIML